MMIFRVWILAVLLLVSTTSATSWNCAETKPDCPAPLSAKILYFGIAETSILLFSLPALSNNRIIRASGGGVLAASGLVSLGTAILVSEMTPEERMFLAIYGLGLIATGIYAGTAPDSHPKTARFGGTFLGTNAALGLGFAVPLFIF
jgi:hypothetical protein